MGAGGLVLLALLVLVVSNTKDGDSDADGGDGDVDEGREPVLCVVVSLVEDEGLGGLGAPLGRADVEEPEPGQCSVGQRSKSLKGL